MSQELIEKLRDNRVTGFNLAVAACDAADRIEELEKQLADAMVGLSYEADIAEMYKEQLSAMTTHNVMLRDALAEYVSADTDDIELNSRKRLGKKALAATADLDKFVLCDSTAWFYSEDAGESRLYRAAKEQLK